ncbi:hypothetical protein SAMN05428963_112101 [Consotaella salsifontis]|uniref:Uncharacterized protein n=1 Tax=Consotaella salsifontis TaxID=1365950 RepID=A0A1T4SPB2_9HYPH|nr:hypothetical protein SAMN05428963_112101 [Consotaella salsifontis]
MRHRALARSPFVVKLIRWVEFIILPREGASGPPEAIG